MMDKRAAWRLEDTVLADAEVTVDGTVLTDAGVELKGHALLARTKTGPRPDVDDCCGRNEELTHLFVGDRTSCLANADSVATALSGSAFSPACGRSGRNATVIKCASDGSASSIGVFPAIACHYASTRDPNGVLEVTDVLLTTITDSDSWSELFRRSYLANCGDDDSIGRQPLA